MTDKELITNLMLLGFTRNSSEIAIFAPWLIEQYDLPDLDVEIWDKESDTVPYSVLVNSTEEFKSFATASELFNEILELLEK